MKRFASALTALLLSIGLAGAQVESALPGLVELLAQADDPQFQLDLLNGMSDGLRGRRGVPQPEGWDAVAAKLSASPNAQVRELVQSLSLVFGSRSALTQMREQVGDPKADAVTRRRVLAALLSVKDPTLAPLLHRLLGDSALRADALRALAAYDHPQTPAAILPLYPRLSSSERRDALHTLASRRTYVTNLLEAVRAKTVPPRDISADLVRQLRQYRDPEIQRQVEQLWGISREITADKQQALQRFKKLLQSGPPGHPSRGRALFARTCQQCHVLFGLGGKVGPDITGSNRADLDYILHNMIDPNAEIPNDYRPMVVETKDDRLVTGIVARQDDATLTLVTANDTVLLSRSEIQSMQQSQLSMMPEGLIDLLKEDELRDLIAYLKSPAQVPMEATADNLDAFFNGKDPQPEKK